MMSEKLIRDYEGVDLTALEDILMVMAKTVENSLIQASAEAGKDYTYIDSYKLSQPYALEIFRKNGNATFPSGT